ncbi:hypothetical protein [Paenibacillus sp. FSL P4-0502]|uniref:hypothetical protein n=1 Tax=Paenibacillus sp. FSL P4-0502 TaxID=2975319 RepID=UPI0030FCBF43
MNIRKIVISKEYISIENGNGQANMQPILLQDKKSPDDQDYLDYQDWIYCEKTTFQTVTIYPLCTENKVVSPPLPHSSPQTLAPPGFPRFFSFPKKHQSK